MKLLAGQLALLSSFALVAVGCAGNEADDLTTTEDALTCSGVHHNPHNHVGHHHHRHHHGHHGTAGTTGTGGGGGRPHLTGTAGMGGSTGTAGSTGMAGTSGTAGTTGSGGSGGQVDPRCAPLDGIVSWWHGDGDFDDSVGSNDGVNGGGVTFATGVDNQGFSLDGGATSYVEVADDPSLMMTTGITIDAWTFQNQLGGRIVDKSTANEGYMLDIVSDRLRMFIGTDAVLSDPLPAGQWVHVAGVFNGSGLGVYINGALSAETVTRGSAILPDTVPVRIGAQASGVGSEFIGMIDEPRIFNRGLTADEIAALYWQGQNCH
jgi:hypothetical protein